MSQVFGKIPQEFKGILKRGTVFALGYLIVLFAQLYCSSWYPTLDAVIFLVAYVPVIVTKSIFLLSDYDLNFDSLANSAALTLQETGEFFSGLLTLTAVSIPVVLYHSNILTMHQMVSTLVGGCIILGSVYSLFESFSNRSEEEFISNDII